eukprot:4104473-Prymnesium_polylepis.1
MQKWNGAKTPGETHTPPIPMPTLDLHPYTSVIGPHQHMSSGREPWDHRVVSVLSSASVRAMPMASSCYLWR